MSKDLPVGTKVPRSGTPKRRVWDAYWRGGKTRALETGERLGIAENSLRGYLSDLDILARGDLPAWMKKDRSAASSGFSERASSFESGDDTLRSVVEVGPAGRIVIPAAIRTRMGVSEGSALVLQFDGEELSIFTPEAGVRRAQRLLAPYLPTDRSLADELVEDRRREAEDELG